MVRVNTDCLLFMHIWKTYEDIQLMFGCFTCASQRQTSRCPGGEWLSLYCRDPDIPEHRERSDIPEFLCIPQLVASRTSLIYAQEPLNGEDFLRVREGDGGRFARLRIIQINTDMLAEKPWHKLSRTLG